MKKFILLLVAVLASLSMWAEPKYIAEVMLIGGTKTETDELKDTYTDQGWTVIDRGLRLVERLHLSALQRGKYGIAQPHLRHAFPYQRRLWHCPRHP